METSFWHSLAWFLVGLLLLLGTAILSGCFTAALEDCRRRVWRFLPLCCGLLLFLYGHIRFPAGAEAPWHVLWSGRLDPGLLLRLVGAGVMLGGGLRLWFDRFPPGGRRRDPEEK